MTILASHEFITVGARRWCVCCDLFQSKEKTAVYFPTPQNGCPQDTPYAVAQRRHNGDGEDAMR